MKNKKLKSKFIMWVFTMPLCLSTAVPTIKTLDQDLVTDAGKPFVMTVPYNAYPHAEAEWLFDNISLPKDNVHTSTDTTEYRLKDPKKSEEGRYKIVIQNKHGKGEAFINLKVVGELSLIFKLKQTKLYSSKDVVC